MLNYVTILDSILYSYTDEVKKKSLQHFHMICKLWINQSNSDNSLNFERVIIADC